MFDNNDPFAGVEFGSQPASVGNDEVLRLLLGGNPKPPEVFADTKGGNARVNANTQETGTVAYKDSKGQTVLTNVARNASTNKEELIAPDAKMPNGQLASARTAAPNGGVQSIDTPNTVFSLLQKLRATQEATTADEIYTQFQQAAVGEQTRIETEAMKFAENKLGIPNLMQRLTQSEQADRAIPGWYQGIGDTSATLKVREELRMARNAVDNEAKNFLRTNYSYNALKVTLGSAEREFQRIQRVADGKERLTLESKNRENARADAAEQRRIAKQEELEARHEALAESLSEEQLKRITTLHAADFSGVDLTNEETKRQARLKAYDLTKGNKDKSFIEAVNADSAQLPVLALKGNKYAQRLAVAQEATASNRTTAEVEQDFQMMQKLMLDPKLIERGLASQTDVKTASARAKEMHMQSLGDPEKQMKLTDQRAQYALMEVRRIKSAAFMNDVASWKSVDPLILAAVDKSKKVTGKSDIENTFTAYVGESTGLEYLRKADEFKQAMLASEARQKDSLFAPDASPALKKVAELVTAKGTFKGWFADKMQALGNTKLEGTVGVDNAVSPIFSVYGGLKTAGNAVIDSVAGTSNQVAVGPLTGKPFDQR